MQGLGLGRVLAYWRIERRTILQGFFALVVSSLGNLAAGLSLGAITGTLERLPGLMVVLPAAIAMRGNIFGALGSRLGTTIHSGLFDAGRRRGGVLQQNILGAWLLTLSMSAILGVLAKVLTAAFGLESIGVADFVVISVLAGILSSLVVGAGTAVLVLQAYRRGWDLDSVTAPVVTTLGDIVTIPSLFLASFAAEVPAVTPLTGGVLGAVGVYAVVRGVISSFPATRRIVRESLPLLTAAATVDVFAGMSVEARLERFVTFPVFLVLFPPLLAGAGALGGVLSSRLSSKLHLGALEPRGVPQSVAFLDTSVVFLFAIVVFTLVGVAAHLAGGVVGLASPGALRVLAVSLTAGLLSTSLAVIVAYYTAVASFRLGVDPDSYGLPAITASMDLVGAIALIGTLLLFGIA